MNAVQMGSAPWLPVRPMGLLLSKPTHTAVSNSGVKPMNHASRWSLVVPVLPAAGHPSCALVPVPRCTLASIALRASAAWPSVKTFLRSGRPILVSTRPPGNTTLVMATGLMR